MKLPLNIDGDLELKKNSLNAKCYSLCLRYVLTTFCSLW